MPNVRITAGSIDEGGNTIWGTGDFECRLAGHGIYEITPFEFIPAHGSAVTCSLNNEFFGPSLDNVITFSKLGDGVQIRIESVADGDSNVTGPFDFMIVSPF